MFTRTKSDGCGSKQMAPFWGSCTTHFRTYCSGDWDVHWGYGIWTHGQTSSTARFALGHDPCSQAPPHCGRLRVGVAAGLRPRRRKSDVSEWWPPRVLSSQLPPSLVRAYFLVRQPAKGPKRWPSVVRAAPQICLQATRPRPPRSEVYDLRARPRSPAELQGDSAGGGSSSQAQRAGNFRHFGAVTGEKKERENHIKTTIMVKLNDCLIAFCGDGVYRQTQWRHVFRLLE